MCRRKTVPDDDVRLIRALGDIRKDHLQKAEAAREEADRHMNEARKLTDALIGEKFGYSKDCISKIILRTSRASVPD